MKIVVEIDTFRIISELPDFVSKESVEANGHKLLEVDNPYLEDGVTYRELTDAELAPIINADWKKERESNVEKIKVEYQGVIYQGDEVSQTRMIRALSVMDDEDTTTWIAKDNSIQVITKEDLRSIARLAGIEQTKLWVKE